MSFAVQRVEHVLMEQCIFQYRRKCVPQPIEHEIERDLGPFGHGWDRQL